MNFPDFADPSEVDEIAGFDVDNIVHILTGETKATQTCCEIDPWQEGFEAHTYATVTSLSANCGPPGQKLHVFGRRFNQNTRIYMGVYEFADPIYLKESGGSEIIVRIPDIPVKETLSFVINTKPSRVTDPHDRNLRFDVHPVPSTHSGWMA